MESYLDSFETRGSLLTLNDLGDTVAFHFWEYKAPKRSKSVIEGYVIVAVKKYTFIT